jgi:hypothetical protein
VLVAKADRRGVADTLDDRDGVEWIDIGELDPVAGLTGLLGQAIVAGQAGAALDMNAVMVAGGSM